jgi:hypothetical protein
LVATFNDGPEKRLADEALVGSTALLIRLGRRDEVFPLIQAYQHRYIADFRQAQIWAKTIEAFFAMVKYPGLAYRCGTFALDNAS